MIRLILLALVVLVASPQDKARCHRQCVDCRVRCKKTQDPKSCTQTCLELKRQCCASCGAGPGPRTTCSCT